MIVYKYDAELKTYCGGHTCQPSPLEKRVFLKPDNSTEIKPPEAGENKVAIFTGDAWSIVDDYRGYVSYDDQGKQTNITEPGELPKTPPADTLVKPEWSNDKWVETATSEEQASKEQAAANHAARQFLADTDWKVIRHIRQKALKIETSLTDEEYLALEAERQQKAASII